MYYIDSFDLAAAYLDSYSFSYVETFENDLLLIPLPLANPYNRFCLPLETFDFFSRQMKHTHELERGELKELVDPVGSRFTSTIAAAGTTLIIGFVVYTS